SFSPPKCARRSDRYAKRAIERRRAGTARRRQTVGALENCHEFRDTQLKWQGSVLFVGIAAPPMNLLGRELLRDLVSLIQQAEADDPIRVLVFKSADPDYFISRVDVTNPLEPSCTTGLAAGTRQCRISVASSSGNVWKCASRVTRTIVKQQNHLGCIFARSSQPPLAWPNSCVPKG